MRLGVVVRSLSTPRLATDVIRVSTLPEPRVPFQNVRRSSLLSKPRVSRVGLLLTASSPPSTSCALPSTSCVLPVHHHSSSVSPTSPLCLSYSCGLLVNHHSASCSLCEGPAHHHSASLPLCLSASCSSYWLTTVHHASSLLDVSILKPLKTSCLF